MSEPGWLFLILAAVYGLECVVWLPPGAFLFVCGRGRRTRLRRSDADARFTPALLPPLPPLRTAFACAAPLAAISPEGLAADATHRLDEIFAVETEGGSVCAGGRRLLRGRSPRAARGLAELLRQLAATPAARRAAAIDAALSRSLDAAEVAGRVERFRSEVDALRWLCNLLFVHLFVAAPLAVGLRGLPLTWAPLLLGMLLLQGLILHEFRRAHRALLPDELERRFSTLVAIGLSPPAACRAVDALARDLLGDVHPAAAAAALLEPAAFGDLARQLLHDLRRFDRPGAVPGRIERWHRRRLGDGLQRLAASCGFGPAELVQPPAREHDGCLAYCPRCHEQYVIPEGQCGSCHDVGLRRFAEPDERQARAATPIAVRS